MARTTVDIPENLLKQAKTEAAQRNNKLQDVIADALRQRYHKVLQATGRFLLYDKKLGVKIGLRRKDIYEDVKPRPRSS